MFFPAGSVHRNATDLLAKAVLFTPTSDDLERYSSHRNYRSLNRRQMSIRCILIDRMITVGKSTVPSFFGERTECAGVIYPLGHDL